MSLVAPRVTMRRREKLAESEGRSLPGQGRGGRAARSKGKGKRAAAGDGDGRQVGRGKELENGREKESEEFIFSGRCYGCWFPAK